MGERSNIVIMDNGQIECVFYGHWMGEANIQYVQDAIRTARDSRVNGNCDRTKHASYFAAIVARKLLKNDIDGALGYGISNRVHHNEYPIVVVNCGTGYVWLTENEDAPELPTNKMTIDEFMEMEVI